MTVQGELEGSASDAVQLKFWQEFIEKPWYAYQPSGSFTYDPATQRYGFQEGFDSLERDLADDFINEPDNLIGKEDSNERVKHVKDESEGEFI